MPSAPTNPVTAVSGNCFGKAESPCLAPWHLYKALKPKPTKSYSQKSCSAQGSCGSNAADSDGSPNSSEGEGGESEAESVADEEVEVTADEGLLETSIPDAIPPTSPREKSSSSWEKPNDVKSPPKAP